MPTIALAAPTLLNDCILQIGTDNYEGVVNKVQFDPTTPVQLWKGMTPGAIVAVAGTPTWMLTIDYPQDHDTANSLTLFLQANAGQIKTFVFKPKKPVTTGTTYTVSALIVPGPIGGALDDLAKGSVQLQCTTQPVKTTA